MNTTTTENAATWHRVCLVDDIPVLGARKLTSSKHGNIALFRNGDNEVFALLDKCPHQGGPLSEGIVHGRSVTCPLHNWCIQFDNGEAVEPDEGCTNTFEVKVEDDEVFIQL